MALLNGLLGPTLPQPTGVTYVAHVPGVTSQRMWATCANRALATPLTCGRC